MVRPIAAGEMEGRRNNRNGIKVKNMRKKQEGHRLTFRQFFLIGFLVILFMGTSIGYVWSNFEGTQIGYDLTRLQQEELQLKEMNQKLRLELATYKSPQSLEKTILRLGLKKPDLGQIVILP